MVKKIWTTGIIGILGVWLGYVNDNIYVSFVGVISLILTLYFLIKVEVQDYYVQDCSNCGKRNEYTKKEVEEVFPHSREKLKCSSCGHTLSVNSWFVGE